MYQLPFYWSYPSQAVIPKFYWEAKSQEQRIQDMRREVTALTNYANDLRNQQQSINENVDARLNALETRMTSAETEISKNRKDFNDYVTAFRSEYDSKIAELETRIDGKADKADTYTKTEADRRFARLEDQMAWRGYYEIQIAETMPRDCIVAPVYGGVLPESSPSTMNH